MNSSKYRMLIYAALLSGLALAGCDNTTTATPPPPAAAVAAIPSDDLGATPEPDTDPKIMQQDQAAQSTALFNVARTLASQTGADRVAVIDFCEQNRNSFGNATEVDECKKLAGMTTAAAPPARTKEEAFKAAATMATKDRFAYCTSDRVIALLPKSEDYDKCFPASAQAELAKLGGPGVVYPSDGPTSSVGQKEQVLLNASRMSQRERNAYCNVPEVVKLLENKNQECLAGLSPFDPSDFKTDQDEGYSDNGN